MVRILHVIITLYKYFLHSIIKLFMLHSEILKKIRKINGLNQKELALNLDESIEKIRNIESGRTQLSVKIATKIEQIYGVDFKWLLTGEGEMFRTEQPKAIEGVQRVVQANVCASCGQAFGLEGQLLAKQEVLESQATIIEDKKEILRMKDEENRRLKDELQKKDQEIAALEQTAQIA